MTTVTIDLTNEWDPCEWPAHNAQRPDPEWEPDQVPVPDQVTESDQESESDSDVEVVDDATAAEYVRVKLEAWRSAAIDRLMAKSKLYEHRLQREAQRRLRKRRISQRRLERRFERNERRLGLTDQQRCALIEEVVAEARGAAMTQRNKSADEVLRDTYGAERLEQAREAAFESGILQDDPLYESWVASYLADQSESEESESETEPARPRCIYELPPGAQAPSGYQEVPRPEWGQGWVEIMRRGPEDSD